jgi:cell division protein FtsW (lipid II flippase)
MKDGGAATFRWPEILSLALPVLAGLGYMAAYQAPRSYLAVNALALGVGIAWTVFGRVPADLTSRRLVAVLLIALLALPLLTGPSIDGVARWIPAGPVTLHAGMLALPALAVLAAEDRAYGPHLLLAGILLSLLQPDAASALAVAGAAAAIAVGARDRLLGLVALAGLVAAFAASAGDDLPPQAFVEHVFVAAAQSSVVLALALLFVLAGSLFVLVRFAESGRGDRLAISGTLVGFTVASIFGSYPTPLIGYGASAILGLALALGLRWRSPR